MMKNIPCWNIKADLLSDAVTTLNLGVGFRTGQHRSTLHSITISGHSPTTAGGSIFRCCPNHLGGLIETFAGHFLSLHDHYVL